MFVSTKESVHAGETKSVGLRFRDSDGRWLGLPGIGGVVADDSRDLVC